MKPPRTRTSSPRRNTRQSYPLLTRRQLISLAAGTVGLIAGGGIVCNAIGPRRNPAEASTEADSAIQTIKLTEPPSDAPEATSNSDLPWTLRIVNKEHRLDQQFAPPSQSELPAGRWSSSERSFTIDSRVFDDLVAMLKAAERDGIKPFVCSTYRTYDYQRNLYEKRIARVTSETGLQGEAAEEEAAFWVAPPGASEHQTGLAADIVDATYTNLDEAQESTDAQHWLMSHCHEYGFILRYPTDKSAVTGIGYEPWHYRYVGREFASDIALSGLCLEEWIAQAYRPSA